MRCAMEKQWFVLHTLTGQENKAQKSIRARVSLERMEDFVGRFDSLEEQLDEQALVESIGEFLKGQKELYRIVFVQKYWYLLSVRSISAKNGISESKTLSILHRMRQKLKAKLRKEGYPL